MASEQGTGETDRVSRIEQLRSNIMYRAGVLFGSGVEELDEGKISFDAEYPVLDDGSAPPQLSTVVYSMYSGRRQDVSVVIAVSDRYVEVSIGNAPSVTIETQEQGHAAEDIDPAIAHKVLPLLGVLDQRLYEAQYPTEDED